MLMYCLDGCTAGSHYYLGFFHNYDGGSLSLLITTTESHPVTYFIEIPRTRSSYSGNVTANNSAVVNLPSSVEVRSYYERDYGIYLKTSSNEVTVIGQSYTSHTTDTYLALPTIKSRTVTEYVYYGMSVYYRSYHSSLLIVGTEDNTTLKLKFTGTFNVYMHYRRHYVYSSREYSFVINRLQTMYIYPYSYYDLSGTKIVTNKPVSVFSGHRCAQVPNRYGSCGYLIEQIPPTIFWGTLHYIAPLATRRSYIIKVLAAYDNTRIMIYCNDTSQSYYLSERNHYTRTLNKQEYCAVYSNNKVLVAQFSGKNGEDPSMVLVSASNNFASKFHFPTFRRTINSLYFINIIVMSQYYQSDMIYLIKGDIKKSLNTQEWVPIRVNYVTEAYVTRVAVLPGAVEVVHTNRTALMTTVVYGVAAQNGYIHPGGPLYTLIGE